MIRIFTDAGHSGEHCTWAFAIELSDKVDVQSGAIKIECDNTQTAEFIAVFFAIYYAFHKYGVKDIELYCDNLHVVDFINGKCNLKNLRRKLIELHKLVFGNKLKVRYYHVHGHSGVELNELCDEKCTEELYKLKEQ